MFFESQAKRAYWFQVFLSFVFEVCLVTAIAYFFDAGIIGFFVILIGLQIFYFIIWAGRSVMAWLYFNYAGRKQMAERLYSYLKDNHYPEPALLEYSSEDYLVGVVNNEALDFKIRLKAAQELGALQAFKNTGLIQKNMMVSLCYEDAIKKYKDSFG